MLYEVLCGALDQVTPSSEALYRQAAANLASEGEIVSIVCLSLEVAVVYNNGKPLFPGRGKHFVRITSNKVNLGNFWNEVKRLKKQK